MFVSLSLKKNSPVSVVVHITCIYRSADNKNTLTYVSVNTGNLL